MRLRYSVLLAVLACSNPRVARVAPLPPFLAFVTADSAVFTLPVPSRTEWLWNDASFAGVEYAWEVSWPHGVHSRGIAWWVETDSTRAPDRRLSTEALIRQGAPVRFASMSCEAMPCVRSEPEAALTATLNDTVIVLRLLLSDALGELNRAAPDSVHLRFLFPDDAIERTVAATYRR